MLNDKFYQSVEEGQVNIAEIWELLGKGFSSNEMESIIKSVELLQNIDYQIDFSQLTSIDSDQKLATLQLELISWL